MSRYRKELQVFIVFPGNEFSSFLDSKVTSQLNSDDLSNVRQALIIPSTSSQPSNISGLILGLDIFVWSASPELSRGMTCVLQTKTWYGKVRLEKEVDVRDISVVQQGLQPAKDSSIFGSKIFLALSW